MNRAVYVIRSEVGPVKVGLASNARRRLSELRVSSPIRLSLEFEGECDASIARQIEKRAHSILAASRKNGEWFAVSVDGAVSAVMAAAAELGYEIRPVAHLKGLEGPKLRPRQTGEPILVRIQPEMLEIIDEWRRKQKDPPNRPEAIRRLVESALQKGK